MAGAIYIGNTDAALGWFSALTLWWSNCYARERILLMEEIIKCLKSFR